VTLTPHVHAYELMKIRILNGGHATIAYPGGLWISNMSTRPWHTP
jgi:mannitol 2-dehydrogenase